MQNSEPATGDVSLDAEVQRLREELAHTRQQLSQEQERRGELELLLHTNPDTALPIYRVFYQNLERMIEENDEKDKKPFAMAMIRLDNAYQRVKNTKDRSKALLFKTTIRIREVIGDTLYQSDRLDEFYVLISDYADNTELYRLFANIAREVAKPHDAPAEGLSFGCQIGLVQYPQHGAKSAELLTNAEIALRFGVHNNKHVVEYSSRMGEVYFRSMRLEQDLHQSTQSGFENFNLVYQPIVDTRGTIQGCESLIRWKHPEMGNVPPPQFIPIAERTGDIRILGRWILYKSCLQLREWHALGYPDLFVSVNLSPIQFTQKDLVASISELLTATGIKGRHLKLEITEGALMSDPEDAVGKLKMLRDLGIRISIDDFGTGYSSLNYLRKLPIDTLKIDKSFIDDVTANAQNQEIVKAIISMGKSLRMETLAEGVETAEQRDFLHNEGCQYIQGYYYSKPVESQVYSDYLAKGASLPVLVHA